MDMTCPKCHGAMRTYERNSVHVDQCTECRGIFLDRGELERLMEAETSWNARESGQAAQPASAAPPQTSAPAGGQGQAAAGGLGAVVEQVMRQAQSASSGHGTSSYGSHGKPYKKKKSFLGELFD